MAAIAGTLTGIAITAENHNAKQKGPAKAGLFFGANVIPGRANGSAPSAAR